MKHMRIYLILKKEECMTNLGLMGHRDLVEDSQEEADRLAAHLKRYASEHDEEFEIDRLVSAHSLVARSHQADLVFLDIDLPGEKNGMEAAADLRRYDTVTPLVFVTNLAQFAVRGYSVNAIDFLVKPVRYYDLAMCMDRALLVVRHRGGNAISIPTHDGMHVTAIRDIIYVEVTGHYLDYHLVGKNETLRVRGSLEDVARSLAGTSFVRVAKSHLANMSHIKDVQGDEVRMDSGDTLYFTRTKKREALATIAAFLGGST